MIDFIKMHLGKRAVSNPPRAATKEGNANDKLD